MAVARSHGSDIESEHTTASLVGRWSVRRRALETRPGASSRDTGWPQRSVRNARSPTDLREMCSGRGWCPLCFTRTSESEEHDVDSA